MSWYECFYKLYSGIGTEKWFIDVCAYVSKERLGIIVQLIYCSVSEHDFESLNF